MSLNTSSPWRLAACAALLASAPFTNAAEPIAEETAESQEAVLDEVIVYGTDGRRITGMTAESELDAEGIAAYGANTIGELLNQVSQDVENTEEGPIILINGKPANGIRSVSDLPPEAVANVQVLPPQAASALGYPPTRRVINVVLRQQFKTGIGNVSVRKATAGQGASGNANFTMVQLVNGNFRNFSLNASRNRPLYEADRGIVSDPGVVPHDLIGNVLAFPASGGEIDPDLSALVGQPVTVLGLPAGFANPTLADLAPFGGITNRSDMGQFRTLISDSYSYGVNVNYNRQLPRRSGMSFNLNASRNENIMRTGATPALLTVPATSPFSPFSRDISLARYLGEPLRQESDPTTVNFQGNLNTQQGKWRFSLDTNFNWRSNTTISERRLDTTALQSAIAAGTLNPFGEIPADLLDDMLVDHARARGYNAGAQLQAMGTVFRMPAGNANASLRGEWRRNEQNSRTTGTTSFLSRTLREDRVASGSLQIPLLGNAQAREKGSLNADITGTSRSVTGSRTRYDYSLGMNWRQGTRFTLGASINRQKVPPPPEQLNAPILALDGYRAHDFIREETVLVRYITGGNPDLGTERRSGTRISGTWKPFVKRDLNLNLEYQRNIGRNAVSQLPPVSADVQAAFPDRYRRDAAGRLFEIDARPVSFERSLNEQIRWGGNYRGVFRAPPPAAPSPGAPRIVIQDDTSDLSGAGWRINGNFTHTWRLSNRRLARAGLPEVDLLRGGTAGYNAASRHEVQSRLGVAHNGTGMQLNVAWRNASHISGGTSGAPNDLTFRSFLRLDLNAFANLDMYLPGNDLMKGVRVSLGVDNVLDAKQRVRDDNGATPLRYQPYLLNPLGRVVGLSLRKNF